MNYYDIDNIYDYIDQSSAKFTHYDASLIVHKVLKSNYRYIGGKQWEFFDIGDNMWKPDLKSLKLETDIKTIISDLFNRRAIYWATFASNGSNINSEIHAQFMSNKLLRTCYKLQNKKFISVVIKEAQSFFDFQNHD